MSELSQTEKYNIMAKRIDKILKTDEFSFDVNFLKAIHKYLFNDLLENAGEFRKTNLFRSENVLNGETVVYSNFFNIERYLFYDMSQENLESYLNLDEDTFIKKICLLNTKLWLTHPFKDGNTRTISVFIRLLFNKLGYSFDNEEFRKYFSFYRDALVLASYSTPKLIPIDDYLELFFRKMLFNLEIDLEDVEFTYNKQSVKKRIKENL